MERSISTRQRREATRRDATRRIGSGRVGSPRSSRPRSANGYTDTIVAIAPPRDTPVYRYGLTPVHTFPFHFLSAPSERASERFFSPSLSAPSSPSLSTADSARLVLPSPLSLSHSLLFRGSFNRRRAVRPDALLRFLGSRSRSLILLP